MSAERYGVVDRAALLAESGLDFLRGMIDGRHPSPPFALATHLRAVEVEEGRIVFEGEPKADFFNPLGTIHGGWTATIIDSAMACAVHSTLKPGEGYTTAEIKVNYVRAILPSSGTLRCEGKVIHRGSTIATAEARLIDPKGRLMAHGVTTCVILKGERGAR